MRKHLGLVTAHVVAGTGLFNDFAAGFTDVFGGRSGTYQKQLASLQAEVVEVLRRKARQVGANWVLGARIDFDEISGKGMQMFMVSASGTAVFAELLQGQSEAVTVRRSITASELRAGLSRLTLVDQARNGRLEFDNETWLALAEFQVVEAVPAIIRFVRTFGETIDAAAPQRRALDFFRTLPVDALQRELHVMLATDPEARPLASRFVLDLAIVDLAWVKEQLGSDDFELRRTALQLLQGTAPSYTAADLPLLQSILDLLAVAFPERANLCGEEGCVRSHSRAAMALPV